MIYCSHWNTTGYGEAAAAYQMAIARFLPSVQLFRINMDTENVAVQIMNAVKSTGDHIVLLHTVPVLMQPIVTVLRESRSVKIKIVGNTVWEQNAFPALWVQILKQLDQVIVPCAWNLRRLKEQCPELADKIALIPHCATITPAKSVSGAEIDRELQIPPGRQVWLCVGQFSRRKGIAETIRAFLAFALQEKEPAPILVVKTFLQNTPCPEEARERILAWIGPLQDVVIVDTQVRSTQFMAGLYDRADVFVQLCRAEGVGLGICHAALRGKPVLAHGHGGHREYLGPDWVPVQHYADEPARMCPYPVEDHSACTDESDCALWGSFDLDSSNPHHFWPVPCEAEAVRRMKLLVAHGDLSCCAKVATHISKFMDPESVALLFQNEICF
jgi:glycosyltransferase involved in cell wall biosynthesis